MNTNLPERPEQPKADPAPPAETPSAEPAPPAEQPSASPASAVSDSLVPVSLFSIIQSPAPSAVVYAPSLSTGPLRQGEILSNVFSYRIVEATPEEDATIEPSEWKTAIVLSHDCDLEQDFRLRAKIATGADYESHRDNLLLSVLLCPVFPEDEIGATIKSQGSTALTRFRQNKEERYQFLRAVDPALDALQEGLSAMGIDFRRYFTLFTEELYGQLQTRCQRRCRLISPYLEHLSRRFTNHLSRVGLPLDHHS